MKRLAKWPLALATALLVGALGGHAAGAYNLAGLHRLDLLLYDWRMAMLADARPDPRIVLVEIDERALAAEGRWPWSRAVLARLIDRIGLQQPRLIALDMVLPEPDHQAARAVLDRLSLDPNLQDPQAMRSLERWRLTLDNDRRLAEALARHRVVLGFMLGNETGSAAIGELPQPVLPSSAMGPRLRDLPRFASHAGNLADLQLAAGRAGHLNALLDRDGKLRALPLLATDAQGQVHGSLSLTLLAGMQAAGPKPSTWQLEPAASAPAWKPLHALALATSGTAATRLALGSHGEVLVPFRRGSAVFARHSAADVLTGATPAGALRGKVVLVGVSAPGLADERMTPLHDALPGSQVHAHALAGLLDGTVLTVPAQAPLIELGVLTLLAGLSVRALQRRSMLGAGVVTLGLMLAVLAGNLAAWHWARCSLPLAASLLLPPLVLALHLTLAYHSATSARSRLTKLFGQYVPPELVNEMSLDAERYSMSSRSAELTVLFADVRGFTGLAERLPAGELSAMMNLLFSHLTDVVRAHRGTLDKYIGDAVMAFWGAPLTDPDHARHAVAAALAMRAKLTDINRDLAERGWPAVDVQIGINTGQMVVGDLGSRHRRAYTVLGDAVNLAARLQQYCSQENLGLVIGDATRRAIPEQLCLALGRTPLRGRDAPEPAWVPLPARGGEHPGYDQVAALWQAMRDALASGDGASARRQLDQIELLQPGRAPCGWQRAQLP